MIVKKFDCTFIDFRFPATVTHGLFIIILFTLTRCTQPSSNREVIKNHIPKTGYDLQNPVRKHEMPKELKEISGLAYFGNGILACINDEEGKVYFFDTKNDQVTQQIKFGKKGDYEGITIVEDTIYVIRSDGNLYHFRYKEKDKIDTKKITTPFKAKNDIEGLTYLSDKKLLLIACKGKADINNNQINGRAIYKMDLEIQAVNNNPYIQLNSESFSKTLKKFGLKSSDHMPFMPSGISVQDSSNNIYIISSVGKLLLVFNPDLEIIAAEPLPRNIFFQPEGICFDEDNNLYIASEGKIRNGYILKFSQK